MTLRERQEVAGSSESAPTTAGSASEPTVSIIVVTYNSARWVRGCLDALQNQKTTRSMEIIVVDNGSSDDTVERVRLEFPHVKLIPSTNRGFGAGNNVGAASAKGEILAFVNPDTIADSSWIDELVAPLSKSGVITTSQVVLMDRPTRINTCGNLIHFTGYSFVNGYNNAILPPSVPAPVAGISGAAFAMRREDWQSIGGFDEEFFLYMEDTDLSWRARAAGLEILLCTASTVRHAYSLDVSAAKLYHLEKGRAMLIRKHFRPHHLILFAPSLVVAEALAWAWASRLGPRGVSAKTRAVRDGWLARVQRQQNGGLQLSHFAAWRMPFEIILSSRTARTCGALANLIFWINTIMWHARSRQGGRAS